MNTIELNEKDYTNEKLFNWIISLINVSNVEYRLDYVPLHELVTDVTDKDKTDSSIESTVIIDNTLYSFEVKLKRRLVK